MSTNSNDFFGQRKVLGSISNSSKKIMKTREILFSNKNDSKFSESTATHPTNEQKDKHPFPSMDKSSDNLIDKLRCALIDADEDNRIVRLIFFFLFDKIRLLNMGF